MLVRRRRAGGRAHSRSIFQTATATTSSCRRTRSAVRRAPARSSPRSDLMMPTPLVTRRRPGEGPSRRHGKPRRASPASARRPRGARAVSTASTQSRRCATASSRRSSSTLRPTRRFSAGTPSGLPNTVVLRHSGHEGRDGADRIRPRRRRALGRFGLLVGQGRAEPCAEGDGPWRRCGRLRVSIGHSTDDEGYRRCSPTALSPIWRAGAGRQGRVSGKSRRRPARTGAFSSRRLRLDRGEVPGPETHYMELTPLPRRHSLKTAGP